MSGLDDDAAGGFRQRLHPNCAYASGIGQMKRIVAYDHAGTGQLEHEIARPVAAPEEQARGVGTVRDQFGVIGGDDELGCGGE